MDPSRLEGEVLKVDDCPSKFFQRKWKDETRSAWNTNTTTESLYNVMVKKRMMITEHITHLVKKWRKDKRDV